MTGKNRSRTGTVGLPGIAAAALVALAGPAALAQGPCESQDDAVIHLPPNYETFLPPSAIGSSFLDPAYQCPIKRLTKGSDPNDPAGSFSGLAAHQYSTWSPFNRTSELAAVHKASPTGVFVVRTSDGSVKRSGFGVFEWMHPRWSRTNKDVFFYNRSPFFGSPCRDLTVSPAQNAPCRIMSYNVESGTHAPVSSEYNVPIGIFSDLSEDGDHLMVCVGAADPNGVFCRKDTVHVYTISTDTTVKLTGGMFNSRYPDDCEITPIGNDVMCRFATVSGDSAPFQLFDGATGAYVKDLLPWNGHWDAGKDTVDGDGDGQLDEVVVLDTSGCDTFSGPPPKRCNYVNCYPGVEKVRISDGARTCLLSWKDANPDQSSWFGKSVHVSINNATGHPWVLISTSDHKSVTPFVPDTRERNDKLPGNWQNLWGTYFNELILAKLDGSSVRRVAHHRSRDDSPTDPGGGYWTFPRAALSNGGGHLLFDSNYNETLSDPNKAYADVYMWSTTRADACAGGFSEGSTTVVPQQRTLYLDGPGALGDNFVGIPALSPVNDFPNDGQKNGFKQLCDIFGLTGSQTTMLQFDAQNGTITTHNCDQPLAPPFRPCQGVLIRPLGVTPPIVGTIPVGDGAGGKGIEGSWLYPVYADGPGVPGDNLFGIPLTIASTSPQVLCQELNLPANTSVIRFDAGAGLIHTHVCGSLPTFNLVPGEAVLIQAPGTPGQKVAEGRVTIN